MSTSSSGVQILTYILAAVFVSIITVLSIIFCVMLKKVNLFHEENHQSDDLTEEYHGLKNYNSQDNCKNITASRSEEITSSISSNDQYFSLVDPDSDQDFSQQLLFSEVYHILHRDTRISVSCPEVTACHDTFDICIASSRSSGDVTTI